MKNLNNIFYLIIMDKWIASKKIDFDKIKLYLNNSIESNHFTNYGPNVQLLEEKIREYYCINNDKSIIVTNNGSTAIQMLASAIQYHHNKSIQWATQSFTFPPSVQGSLMNTIIIDLDNEGGIDLDKIDVDIIDGIIITNIFGNVVNIEKYEQWATTYNKYIIFDNAATSYTFYKNKNCLNYGNGCSISFHHTKPFGFGEGGAIIVDNKYEKEVRCLINFGINLTNNYYVKEGNNAKMSDISAAYILQYLDVFFNKIIEHHSNMYIYFQKQIETQDIHSFKLFPSYHDNNKITPACFALLFNEYYDKYEKILTDNNIICRKYYHPIKDTTISKCFYNNILCIPCHLDINEKHIDNVIQLLLNINKY